MSVTNIFDLDMNQKPIDEYYAFNINQSDYQSRIVQANLYITYTKGGSRAAYNLTSETVTISYEYTDENGDLIETYEFSCTKATSIGNNVITFVIPNVAVENAGSAKAQVKIYKIYEDVSTVLNSVLFSFYINESLTVGLTPDTELPLLYVAPIIGSVNPTTSTVGLLGQLYINDVSSALYYCSDITGSVYTWTPVTAGIPSGGTVGQAVVKASLTDYDTEWANVLKPTDVVNNLTTTDDDAPLSATQGKVLQDNKVEKSLFDVNTILAATAYNTPAAVTIAEQKVLGRVTGGNIAALDIDSDLSSVSANDDTIPSAKATKAALDGKVSNSLFDANTVLYATSDDIPAALTVAEQTLVGRLTGGNIDDIAIGIADNNIVQIDHAAVSDNDYAKFTANGLEGRSYSEVLSDIGAETTINGMAATEFSGAYNGVNLETVFATEIAGYSDVWAWIKARTQAEDFSGLHVHDYIEVTCTNVGAYVLKFEIAGINTYKGSGGTEITSHIDWITKDCWPDTVAFNPVNYNNGIGMDKFTATAAQTEFQLTYRGDAYPASLSSATLDGTPTTDYTYSNVTGILTYTGAALSGGEILKAIWTTAVSVPFMASNLCAYMNSLKMGVPNEAALDPFLTEVDYTAGGIYYYLPAALKAVISAKQTYAATRYTAGSLLTASNNASFASVGLLWVPEEMEVIGTPLFATGTVDKYYNRQYPAFAGGNRKKGAGNGGSRSGWWMFSAFSNSANVCSVFSSGLSYSDSTSTATNRTPVCFRILKT